MVVKKRGDGGVLWSSKSVMMVVVSRGRQKAWWWYVALASRDRQESDGGVTHSLLSLCQRSWFMILSFDKVVWPGCVVHSCALWWLRHLPWQATHYQHHRSIREIRHLAPGASCQALIATTAKEKDRNKNALALASTALTQTTTLKQQPLDLFFYKFNLIYHHDEKMHFRGCFLRHCCLCAWLDDGPLWSGMKIAQRPLGFKCLKRARRCLVRARKKRPPLGRPIPASGLRILWRWIGLPQTLVRLAAHRT